MGAESRYWLKYVWHGILFTAVHSAAFNFLCGRLCKYIWIHCTDVVLKLPERWFCLMMLRLRNQDFIKVELQSENALSYHKLTSSLNGLIFNHNFWCVWPSDNRNRNNMNENSFTGDLAMLQITVWTAEHVAPKSVYLVLMLLTDVWVKHVMCTPYYHRRWFLTQSLWFWKEFQILLS